MIASAIDKLIETLSPSKALVRKLDRERLRLIERRAKRSETYAAAKTNRLTGDWSPVTANVNDVIGSSSMSVRNRVRQLVRDFPYFGNAVNKIVTHVVGPGIVYQCKIKDRTGNLNTRMIQEVEDAFNWWADEADVAKKLHFYELMQLAKRQDIETGEYILVKRWRPNDKRYLPFAIQAYEADWLTTQFDRGYGTHIMAPVVAGQPSTDIYQGIEYDRFTGQVIAYHFTDPDNWGKPIRIKAEDVIHGFETLRPGQLRGISPFAPGVLLAHDLQDYMEAEIDAAKMAAKYLAFVKSPSPAGMQLNLETDTTGEETQYIDELENAIIEYLNPGEEVTLASNPRPGTSFPPFVRLVLTMLSATTGIPYEMLSGDYQGLNYSTSRTARNDFAADLRPIAVRHVRHFCMPIQAAFLDYAVLAGKVSLPGYFDNPQMYRKAEWQPPGLAPIDPLKETKAAVDAINNRVGSPQEFIRSKGRDPEEVLKEIKQWQEWSEEYGINEPEKTSTSSSNNPAAVEEQKSARLIKIRR